MKKLYISSGDTPGQFLLSSYSIENEEWEKYHTEIDLLPRKRNDPTSCSVEVQILSNILFAAGISLIQE